MFEIANVEGFTDVLIHIGNYVRNTSGCVLVGTSVGREDDGTLCVWQSGTAYAKVYTKIIKALKAGEDVTLNIVEGGAH